MPTELFPGTSRLTISTAQSHTGSPTGIGRMPVFQTLGHIFLSCKVALLECRVHRLSHEAPLVWGSPVFTLVLKPDREQTLLWQLGFPPSFSLKKIKAKLLILAVNCYVST